MGIFRFDVLYVFSIFFYVLVVSEIVQESCTNSNVINPSKSSDFLTLVITSRIIMYILLSGTIISYFEEFLSFVSIIN